jgi:large subunit ribosomal protein L15
MSMIHEITGGLANKRTQRRGRGESSGRGKTCGRGGKGATARSGRPHWTPGYEGGQTPIHRRMPKRGFSNDPFATEYHIVNLASLDKFAAGATIDASAMAKAGLIPDTNGVVKILGDGKLTKKVSVVADWFSKSALAKILELGGEAKIPAGTAFQTPKPKKKFVLRAKAPKAEAGKGEAPKAEAPKAGPAKDEAAK